MRDIGCGLWALMLATALCWALAAAGVGWLAGMALVGGR
jgi:hypothetical protein